jgi:uncharacterized protein YndB with AHSA1/START domain
VKIDVTHQVNEVARKVTDRMFEAGEARSVTVAQTYDTTVEDLWDACTTPDRIARWLTPVTGDLRLGGNYQLEGNAGGEITECEPPHRFAATWVYGDAVSWIEVRFSDAGDGRARFELEHIARVEEHWTEFGPGAVGIGWDLAVLGLHLYLSSGTGVDYAEVQAWTVSEEGRRFMVESGAAWREADIASGTDPADATQRSDNTIAAYTASPEDGAEPEA